MFKDLNSIVPTENRRLQQNPAELLTILDLPLSNPANFNHALDLLIYRRAPADPHSTESDHDLQRLMA